MQPQTNWQKAYYVRTAIEAQLNNLSEAIASKDLDDIISSFNSFAMTIQESKKLFEPKLEPAKLHCAVFDEDIISEERLKQCKTCIEKTDTDVCKHLEIK